MRRRTGNNYSGARHSFARTAGKARPILHVHVMDDLTGHQLADVDAGSTADALAYFLRARRLEDVTEATVKAAAGANSATAEIVREHRNPISGVLELALAVHVEADCADRCVR